jgi:hypothetical protein
MIIYYNIRHLLNRIRIKERKLKSNINLRRAIGLKYNLNTPIDTYILTKLSHYLNYNFFDFMNEEMELEFESRDINIPKKILMEELILKIRQYKFTEDEILYGLNFIPSKPNVRNRKFKIGKTIQFLMYSKGLSLHEFSEKHRISIQEIFNTILKKDMSLNEVLIWSHRLDINLLSILSLHFESNINHNI